MSANSKHKCIKKSSADIQGVCYQELDSNGNILDVNHEWEKLSGYTIKEVKGKFFGDFVTKETFENMKRNFPTLKDYGEVNNVHFYFVSKDKEETEVLLFGCSEYSNNGIFERTHCWFSPLEHFIKEKKVLSDVLAIKDEFETSLAFQKSYIEKVLNALESPIFTYADKQVGLANKAFMNLFDISTLAELELGDKKDELEKFIDEIYTKINKPLSSQVIDYKHEGKLFLIKSVKIHNDNGHVYENLIELIDITEKLNAKSQLDKLSNYDIITNLPNRKYFLETLENAMNDASQKSNSGLLIYMDLDRFKFINDSLGHNVGDNILYTFGERVKSILREHEFFARVGGDEFALILRDYTNEHDIITLIERIKKTLELPFVIEEHSIKVTLSIGIAIFHKDGDNATEIVRAADTAMYEAKSNGKNGYQFYNKTISQNIINDFLLQSALDKAIQKNEFFMVYQPKVLAETGKLYGYEALIRWHHENLGYIVPDHFITLSETTGQINSIGKWVISNVFAKMSEWKNNSINFGKVAINLSSVQMNSTLLKEYIQEQKELYNIDAKEVEFEITETALMKIDTAFSENLNYFKKAGFGVSLDDFGTGYSNLSKLKSLPITSLKIDKSYIDNIIKESVDKKIVIAILAMARSLEFEVVAEGVETKEQLDFLKKHGCDLIQGYYFSKPLRSEDIKKIEKIY